eukprot:2903928-Amphidinium_carterae.1
MRTFKLMRRSCIHTTTGSLDVTAKLQQHHDRLQRAVKRVALTSIMVEYEYAPDSSCLSITAEPRNS